MYDDANGDTLYVMLKSGRTGKVRPAGPAEMAVLEAQIAEKRAQEQRDLAVYEEAKNWWNNDLTESQRRLFVQGASLAGSVGTRRRLVLEIYRKYHPPDQHP